MTKNTVDFRLSAAHYPVFGLSAPILFAHHFDLSALEGAVDPNSPKIEKKRKEVLHTLIVASRHFFIIVVFLKQKVIVAIKYCVVLQLSIFRINM